MDREEHLRVLVPHLPDDVGRVGSCRQRVRGIGVPGLIGPSVPDPQIAERGGSKVVSLAPLIVQRLVRFHILENLSIHSAHHRPRLSMRHGRPSSGESSP